jgi:putative DNA primase/helicase
LPSSAYKSQILERLNFEAFYLDELQNLKPTSGDNHQALCPFHDDKNPSLSVNFKTGLFKCFACEAQGDVFEFYMRRHGVEFKEALAELGQRAGVAPETKNTGYLSLTLKEFALGKRLPEDFLRSQGIKENRFPDGVISTDFHYQDQAGKLMAIRHRFGNTGAKKFRWRKGDKVRLYGLWKWEKIVNAGWVLLVEGETDCLTCWQHGLPALGLPGKKTWKRCAASLGVEALEELRHLEVYLWQEPDALQLPLEVAKDLPEVLVIPAPADFKDLSQAHCQGQEIKPLIEELKKKSQATGAAAAHGGRDLLLERSR